MKKSSVALLLVFMLMVSGFSAYAASEFGGTLSFSGRDYTVATASKAAVDNPTGYAYYRLTYSNCPDARTGFKVVCAANNEMASVGAQVIFNTDYGSHTINYKSNYINYVGSMRLCALVQSEHTGYFISGEWNPNG